MNHLIAKRDLALACGQIIAGLGAVGVLAELTALIFKYKFLWV